jgi:hypothetical protein
MAGMFSYTNVTLVEKDSNSSGKRNNHGVEQAGGRTLDDIHAAARTSITAVKQSDPKEHDTAEVTLAEKGATPGPQARTARLSETRGFNNNPIRNGGENVGRFHNRSQAGTIGEWLT